MTTQYKRRKKLIKPALQLRLTGAFAGVVALTVILQTLLVTTALTRTASSLPNGGRALSALIPELVGQMLLASLVLIAPLTVLVGVLSTFRIAGPVFRFETFLRAVTQGVEVRPCKLRKGDHLQPLCELINAATAEMRQSNAERLAEDDEAPRSLAG